MKKGNLFITLGLSIGVIFGTAISLNASQEVNEMQVAAVGETSSWGIRGSGDDLSWSSNVSCATTNSGTLHCWKRFTFTSGTVFKLTDGSKWLGFDNLKFGNAKSSFKEGASDGNIECVTPGTYDVCVAWNGTGDYVGIWNSGTLADTLNWDTIYVLQFPNDYGNWNPSKIYAYGGLEQFDTFSKSTGIGESASGTVNLAGSYGNIRTISYLPSAVTGDTGFNLHNGVGYQSTDTAFVNGSAYYMSGKDGYGKATLTSNADLGVAAKFIVDAEYYRNAVTADGDMILDYSICGINPSVAAELYEKYEYISDNNAVAKGYIDATTITTYEGKYDGESIPENSTVAYSDIMNSIYAIALKDSEFAKTHASKGTWNFVESESTNTSIIAVSIVSAIVIGTASACIAIKKMKEE